ncbi:hypothetical protein IF2G_07093 [Cordyceps javanica]|nr:hypothetical protein IF2G_07093 [Cordyceps javanica]
MLIAFFRATFAPASIIGAIPNQHYESRQSSALAAHPTWYSLVVLAQWERPLEILQLPQPRS